MAKPKTIVLVRHGESQGNKDMSMYHKVPDYAIRLTEDGIEQAQEAGRKLAMEDGKFAAYVSPYFRTRQTYDNIAGVLGDRVISKRESVLLREQEWCKGIGKHTDLDMEAERLQISVFYYRFRDGESNADGYMRAHAFLQELREDFEDDNYPENALIVSHGMFIRVLLMKLLRLSVEEFEVLRNPYNCERIFLDLGEDGKYKLRNPLRKRDKPSHNWIY